MKNPYTFVAVVGLVVAAFCAAVGVLAIFERQFLLAGVQLGVALVLVAVAARFRTKR
jgi:hypothetical protein